LHYFDLIIFWFCRATSTKC